jgi:SAM-dependent methyltransferase
MTEDRADRHYEFYPQQYKRFGSDISAEIRREVYGEDLGQLGWRTLDEQAQIAELFRRSTPCHVLDVACGSGGPSLALVASTGCTLTGIDIEASAIAQAQRLASERGASEKARFLTLDCRISLPFENDSFDVIVCIDAVLHLGDRFAILADWARLLRPSGLLLFTDAAVLTGAVSMDELEIRASQGDFLLVPPGLNETAVAAAGLVLHRCDDRTRSTADLATRLHAARERRSSELAKVEGLEWFSQRQSFLAMTAKLASSGRLSRFLYIAGKPAIAQA